MSDPYINSFVPECSCDDPRLGHIDSDRGTVYCGSCDCVLGHLDDAVIKAINYIEEFAA